MLYIYISVLIVLLHMYGLRSRRGAMADAEYSSHVWKVHLGARCYEASEQAHPGFQQRLEGGSLRDFKGF